MIDAKTLIGVFAGGWQSGPADVMICIESLRRTPNVWRVSKAHELRRIAQKAAMPEGEIIVGICEQFCPHKDHATGLAYAYNFLGSVSPARFPMPSGIKTVEELARAWNDNKFTNTKNYAERFVVDSLVSLADFVADWNAREERGFKRRIANCAITTTLAGEVLS